VCLTADDGASEVSLDLHCRVASLPTGQRPFTVVGLAGAGSGMRIETMSFQNSSVGGLFDAVHRACRAAVGRVDQASTPGDLQ
jgi:hypothetical protein